MISRFHFLLITDNVSDYEYQRIQEILSPIGTMQITTKGKKTAYLQRQAYDIVVVDADAFQDPPEAVSQLLTVNPKLRIIVITALSHWKIAKAVIQAGAKDYLEKPLNKKELLESFKGILEEKRDENEDPVC